MPECGYQLISDAGVSCKLAREIAGVDSGCLIAPKGCGHCLKFTPKPSLDNPSIVVAGAALNAVEGNEQKTEEVKAKCAKVLGTSLNNAPAKSTTPSPPNLDCIHRGEFAGIQPCDMCMKTKGQPVQTFECEVHGVCTFHKSINRIKGCAACLQRNDGKGEQRYRPELNGVFPPPNLKPLPSPQIDFLFDSSGRPANCWRDTFKEGSVILCCGGPSLTPDVIQAIQRPGIVLAAVNNVGVLVRPHLWFCIDEPERFSPSVWKDPAIAKFSKRKRAGNVINAYDSSTQRWVPSHDQVRSVPNSWFFEHCGEEQCRRDFGNDNFLTSPNPFWTHKEKHSYSVMFIALRMLYWLGFRQVFLAGCDWHMKPGNEYAFEEPKESWYSATNNKKYEVLDTIFHGLKSHFYDYGFSVYNATQGTRMTAFPRCTIPQAVDECLKTFPAESVTKGLYVPRDKHKVKAV